MKKRNSELFNDFRNKINYAGLEKETYQSIEDYMVDYNIKNLRVISIAAAIYALVFILLIRFKFLTDSLIIPYTYLFVVSVAYYVLSPFVSKRSTATRRLVYYFFMLLFFIFGQAVGTIFSSGAAVTFNVMLFMLAFLPDTSRYTVPFIVINVVLFNVMVTYSDKSSVTLFNDRFNSVIFGIMSIYFNFRISRRSITQVADQQKAEREKDYDGLTKLFNKTGAERRISDLLKDHVKGYLIVIDIDHFKQVNDQNGHLYGDYIIQSVARLLKKSFREDDIISRFGGDEFVIFVKNADRHIIVERMHAFYQQLTSLDHITCSAGLAESHDNSYEELFEEADQALYKVKKNGRDGFKLYDEISQE